MGVLYGKVTCDIIIQNFCPAKLSIDTLYFSFWPNIDDALKTAAFNRKVQVRLLASYWNHTWDDMFLFLRSLNDIRTHYSAYPYINIEVVRISFCCF